VSNISEVFIILNICIKRDSRFLGKTPYVFLGVTRVRKSCFIFNC